MTKLLSAVLCFLNIHNWSEKASSYKHIKYGKSYIEGKKCPRCGKTRI